MISRATGTGFVCTLPATSHFGGSLPPQDAGYNAQDLFYAPLVHKQSSNLIRILATEVRM